MKKILFIAALGVAFTGTSVMAQTAQKPTKGQRMTRSESREDAVKHAENTAARMAKELDLTDSQQKEVMALALDSYTQKPSLETRQKYETSLDKILTPEQKVKRAALQEQKRKDVTNGPVRIGGFSKE